MDDRRFDSLTKRLATGVSRRTLIKGLLGIGGIAAAGSVAREDEVRAARRPTPTPKPVTCPGQQVPCATGCCCPGGATQCGAECCPDGQATCCDGACCYGTCYGEGLCCEGGNPVCSVDGCCSGVCVDNGQHCCRPAAVCGDACCQDTERCCTAGVGAPVCRPAGACCVDADCIGGVCDRGICIPYTSTPQPTATNTPTNTPVPPTNTPTATPTNTPTATSTSTPSNTPTPTPTLTPIETPEPIQVAVAITAACFPQAIVSNFPPNYSIPEVRFLAKRADGTEFSLGTYAHQFTTDSHGNVLATGTAPIVNSAIQVRATASIESTVYTSNFIQKTCSITPTPSNTPTLTPTATVGPPQLTIVFTPGSGGQCQMAAELTNFRPSTRYDADLLLAPPDDHSQPIPFETRSGTTDASGFVRIPFLYTSGPNFLDVQVAVGALSTNWTAVAC